MNQIWHTHREERLQLEGRRKGIATLLVEGPGIELSEELPSREEIKELTVCINALLYLGEDLYLVALYHMLGCLWTF